MSKRTTPMFLLVAVCAMTMLMGAKKQGCGEGLDNRPDDPGIDVGGTLGATWDLQYEKTMDVVVKRAGVVVSNYTVAVGAGGTIDLEGATIDMDAYCNRTDVVCPYDVFPETVRMTQPGNNRHLLYIDYTAKGPLAGAQDVRLYGNVDSDDDFSIALGVNGATGGVCGLLGFSYASGHINGDGDPVSPKGISLAGDIVTAYGAGCLLVGTSAGAGAGVEVELNIPFTGLRR